MISIFYAILNFGGRHRRQSKKKQISTRQIIFFIQVQYFIVMSVQNQKGLKNTKLLGKIFLRPSNLKVIIIIKEF